MGHKKTPAEPGFLLLAELGFAAAPAPAPAVEPIPEAAGRAIFVAHGHTPVRALRFCSVGKGFLTP